LEIEIGEKLRDERKFGSLEELKAQIARDVAGAKRRF
jgi:FAD synthase